MQAVNQISRKKEGYSETAKMLKYGGAFAVFLFTLWMTRHLEVSRCPDEWMRILVPEYIASHNRLPVGTETEILNKQLGFSYAFTPYLPSLISAFFIKFAVYFRLPGAVTVSMTRLPSIFAAVFSWLLCWDISEEAFRHQLSGMVFASGLCLVPQFLFLGSYLNNDCFGVMCCLLILLAWLKGRKDQWSVKSCLLLGFGCGLLALTYYNDYGFLLCSLIWYFATSRRMHRTAKQTFTGAGIVLLTAFAIAGWFFIRNAVIHNGDFIGMNSMYEAGRIYGLKELYLENRPTPHNLGQSIWYVLFDENSHWARTSLESAWGVFGNMDVRFNDGWYHAEAWITSILAGLGILQMIIHHKQIHLYEVLCLVLCMAVPVILSIRYTMVIDYQAQGRYIISSWIPLVFVETYGIDRLRSALRTKISYAFVMWCGCAAFYAVLCVIPLGCFRP